MKRTIRADVVVPMQSFSYFPGPSLRTFGAVCRRNAPERSIGGSIPWSKIRICVRSRIPMMCALDDDLVAGAKLEDLGRVGDGERDLVRRHHASLSYSMDSSAATCAEARRAAQHW